MNVDSNVRFTYHINQGVQKYNIFSNLFCRVGHPFSKCCMMCYHSTVRSIISLVRIYPAVTNLNTIRKTPRRKLFCKSYAENLSDVSTKHDIQIQSNFIYKAFCSLEGTLRLQIASNHSFFESRWKQFGLYPPLNCVNEIKWSYNWSVLTLVENVWPHSLWNRQVELSSI